jgi:hypothetical protein
MVEAATFSQVLPAARCRIELLLNQGGACGAVGPASAPGSALEGPPGARRTALQEASRSRRLICPAGRAAGPSFLGFGCPARGHRVKSVRAALMLAFVAAPTWPRKINIWNRKPVDLEKKSQNKKRNNEEDKQYKFDSGKHGPP